MTERIKGTTGSDAWTCYLPTTPGVLGVPRGAPRSHALAQTQSTNRIWTDGGDAELHAWLGAVHGFE